MGREGGTCPSYAVLHVLPLITMSKNVSDTKSICHMTQTNDVALLSCRACVGARDPYCVWNMNSLNCEPNPFTAINDTVNADTSG